MDDVVMKTNFWKTKAEIIASLRTYIAKKDDDELFSNAIHECFLWLGLDEKDAAEIFSMSVPSVKRWLNGTTAPYTAMRVKVYEKFIEMIEKS